MALGDEDPFVFVLAQDLGMHLHDVDQMAHRDYVRWIAFYELRAAQRELAEKRAAWKTGKS